MVGLGGAVKDITYLSRNLIKVSKFSFIYLIFFSIPALYLLYCFEFHFLPFSFFLAFSAVFSDTFFLFPFYFDLFSTFVFIAFYYYYFVASAFSVLCSVDIDSGSLALKSGAQGSKNSTFNKREGFPRGAAVAVTPWCKRRTGTRCKKLGRLRVSRVKSERRTKE